MRRRRALTLACERGQHGCKALALRLLGEIAPDHNPSDVDPAVRHYREALALAEELAMRPLVAHCQLGLGKLYGRTGERDQAQEHLTTATAMFREMEMGFWLERAEAQAFDMYRETLIAGALEWSGMA